MTKQDICYNYIKRIHEQLNFLDYFYSGDKDTLFEAYDDLIREDSQKNNVVAPEKYSEEWRNSLLDKDRVSQVFDNLVDGCKYEMEIMEKDYEFLSKEYEKEFGENMNDAYDRVNNVDRSSINHNYDNDDLPF